MVVKICSLILGFDIFMFGYFKIYIRSLYCNVVIYLFIIFLFFRIVCMSILIEEIGYIKVVL